VPRETADPGHLKGSKDQPRDVKMLGVQSSGRIVGKWEVGPDSAQSPYGRFSARTRGKWSSSVVRDF
jgi:hypothetical protein